MIRDGGDDEWGALHLKNSRAFALLSNPIYPSNRHWISWAFPAPRFTVGMTVIKVAARKLWKTNRPDWHVCWSLQSSPIPREHQQPHTRRRLLRTRISHFEKTWKDQAKNDGKAALATPQTRRLIWSTRRARASLKLGCWLFQFMLPRTRYRCPRICNL